MNTLAALGIAGAAGVALYLVHRGAAPVAPSRPAQSPQGNGGYFNTAESLINKGANAIGTEVGRLTGAGPAAPLVGAASGGFIKAEVNAWSQVGSGGKKLASGNVWGGTKDIVVGGVKTAVAPVTGVYNTVKGWL